MSSTVIAQAETMFPPLTQEQLSQIYSDFSSLQGRILTILDSVLPEGQQNKAAKDVATEVIWNSHMYLINNLDSRSRYVNQNVQVKAQRGKK